MSKAISKKVVASKEKLLKFQRCLNHLYTPWFYKDSILHINT